MALLRHSKEPLQKEFFFFRTSGNMSLEAQQKSRVSRPRPRRGCACSGNVVRTIIGAVFADAALVVLPSAGLRHERRNRGPAMAAELQAGAGCGRDRARKAHVVSAPTG